MSELKKHINRANLIRLLDLPLHVILLKIIIRTIYLILSCICFIFALILYVCNWRVQNIDMTRIGHLTITALCTINDQNINLNKLKILVPLNHEVANENILKYFPNNYHFISNKLINFIVKSISFWSFIRLPSDEYIIQPRPKINAFNLLSGTYNHFELDLKDELWLRDQINNNYRLNTDWFIVIHNRSSDYSQKDYHTQSYRNCDIENYNAAIDYIISQGGTVFRIGIHDGKILEPRNFLYDIRSSKNKRLQLCLSAKCKFFLGCSSGAAFMATFFGKPVALANLIPVTTMPFTKNDLGIHKSIVDNKTGKKLSISETLNSSVADAFVSSMYDDKYSYIENGNEDILKLSKAMLHQINGRKINSFSMDLKPADYAFKTMAKTLL